jgi:hypothetical protein
MPAEVRDPAIAIAIAHCYMAQLGLYVGSHPRRCRFCQVPSERKLQSIVEFNTWTRLEHNTVLEFTSLTAQEQRDFVTAAQYGDLQESA